MKIPTISLTILAIFTITALKGQEIPTLNSDIISYVKSVIGQKVDLVECWDLAYQALNRADATWDGQYQYGKRLNPATDTIYPGDIIQFENVKIKYSEGLTTHTETMAHHTAIIYEVLNKGHYRIAHQNTGFSGRKVGLSELQLKHVVRGKLFIYRPQK